MNRFSMSIDDSKTQANSWSRQETQVHQATATLMHLHLTFSGVVCILSLQERQEHCPFTTRLRVLKLTSSRLMEYSTKQIHAAFSPHVRGASSAWT